MATTITFDTYAYIKRLKAAGFMARLNTYETLGKPTSDIHFASGTISMFQPNRDATSLQFAVSSTVIERGFSGSAVFVPG